MQLAIALICRTSISVDHDLYYFVDEMYSVQNVSTVDLSKYNIDHIDTLTFLRTAAHQLTDFIDRSVKLWPERLVSSWIKYISTDKSIYLSIYIHLSLSIYLSIYPSIYLSIHLSIYLSIYLYPSIYQSICLSMCVSICVSVGLSLSDSLCLSICLTIYLKDMSRK